MENTSPRNCALVTGASRGIGAAIARRLAAGGLVPILAARGLAGCEQVAGEIRAAGGRAEALELDVTSAASLEAALPRLRALAEPHGGLGHLVHNAGIARSAPLAKSGAQGGAEDLYRAHLDVNFLGPVRLTEALLGELRDPACSVVSVASSAGLRGYAYVAAYCASKHALVGWTRAAALECAETGPRFAAVCPHYVDSPMLEESVRNVMEKTGRTRDDARAFFAAENPGGALVTVEQVAEAVLGLCRGELAGTVVELDGGSR